MSAGQRIAWVNLIGASGEYGDMRLTGCTLRGCRLVQSDDPGFGLVVRDVALERCRMEGCVASGVYFDDVTVDTLHLARLHLLSGCVFRHVTLRGKIGPVMAIPPHPMSRLKSEFTAGIVQKYKEVDWALDISEAVFSDADFYYVPGELIRRDVNTQVLLRREAFGALDPRGLPGYARHLGQQVRVDAFRLDRGYRPQGIQEFR